MCFNRCSPVISCRKLAYVIFQYGERDLLCILLTSRDVSTDTDVLEMLVTEQEMRLLFVFSFVLKGSESFQVFLVHLVCCHMLYCLKKA